MTAPVDTVLCDLDGVIWLAHRPIPGAVEAVHALQANRCEVVFVTNNSTLPPEAVQEVLADIGIHGRVLGSAAAAASLIAPAERVAVCGERGILAALEDVGAHLVDLGDSTAVPDCDAVVVGLSRGFDYRMLDRASAAIRAGARFIATNDDPTYPTPDGPVPGAGSLVAAVAAASGVAPVLAGKPHQPMVDLVLSRTASGPSRMLMVGDRLSTDGRFAQRIGCRFAWVRTGVGHDLAEGEQIPMAIEAADLGEVARAVIHGPGLV